MPHVNDESLPVEHRKEPARPVGDVAGPHGAEMHVTNLSLPGLLHAFTAAQFPFVVAEI